MLQPITPPPMMMTSVTCLISPLHAILSFSQTKTFHLHASCLFLLFCFQVGHDLFYHFGACTFTGKRQQWVEALYPQLPNLVSWYLPQLNILKKDTVDFASRRRAFDERWLNHIITPFQMLLHRTPA